MENLKLQPRLPKPKLPRAVQRETMNESGANILRSRIERYWRERGVTVVEVWIEPMPWQRTGGVGGWVVRSNLRGGMLPGTEISFPISSSVGHRSRADNGQSTPASLLETEFAGGKGHQTDAVKASTVMPPPGEPSSARRKDQK